MSTNGTNGTTTENVLTGPIVRRVLTDSGVEVDVTPLSPHALALLRAKTQELYPDPDEEQYRKPVPNSAIADDTFIDKDDPEYIRLKKTAVDKRTELLTRALRDTSLSFPAGKAALIAHFADKIKALRLFVDLPEDEWEATFWHGIIGSAADHETLVRAAENALPLTEMEVANGVRLFRYIVQGQRPSELVARTLEAFTSRIQQRAQSKP